MVIHFEPITETCSSLSHSYIADCEVMIFSGYDRNKTIKNCTHLVSFVYILLDSLIPPTKEGSDMPVTDQGFVFVLFRPNFNVCQFHCLLSQLNCYIVHP